MKFLLVSAIFAVGSSAFYAGFRAGHAQCKQQIMEVIKTTDWGEEIKKGWQTYPEMTALIDNPDIQRLAKEVIQRKFHDN